VESVGVKACPSNLKSTTPQIMPNQAPFRPIHAPAQAIPPQTSARSAGRPPRQRAWPRAGLSEPANSAFR